MNDEPLVRLRAHHLLCILTYVGKGYNDAYAANFNGIIDRIHQGAAIEVMSGPDDICRPMITPESTFHCCEDSTTVRDVRAAESLSNLLQQNVSPGAVLRLNDEDIAQLRQNFAQGVIRSACKTCPWENFCTDIAGGGFAQCRLLSLKVHAIT